MPEPAPKTRLSYCKDIIQQRLSDAITALTPRRRFSCLPIRVPVSPEIIEDHPVYSALQEMLNRTFLNLYALDQALLQSDSKGGHFQRSPSNPDLLRLTYDVPEPQTFATTLHLEHVADDETADDICVLYNLRLSLAVFLSQFYMEIDKFGKTMSPSSEESFASLLITLNDYFSNLEASISAIGVGYLSFDKLYNYRDQWPDVNTWDDRWSHNNTEDALCVMDTNLNKLDEYVSTVVSKYRKPWKITQHWVTYIFGAIGISIFSVWLIRSGIVDNWVLEAKKIFSGEQALTAVRDEVLETMRSRQKEEMKQVQSTSNLLHSMLLDISERIKGEKTPSNVSDHEMLEIATTSFEEQLKHPIRNFIWGELPRLLHIQHLKQTHDIEASMCELNQKILMDYEMKIPFIPSLRTLSISFGALMISHLWVRQTKTKRRSARVKRRLLLDELEERIMEFQNLSLSNEHGHYINGLVLYTLDRLYKSVERLAKADGEWQWVRNDITLLGEAYLETSDKLLVTSRLHKAYKCLLPNTEEELTLRMDVEKHRWLAQERAKQLSCRNTELV